MSLWQVPWCCRNWFWLTFRGGLTECDVSGVWWDGRTLLL